MVAGFPEGTPLRRAMNFTYNHVAPLQFLRTTYKAGPLLALGLAVPGGSGAGRRGLRAARWRAGARRASSPCWPRSRAGRWCAGRRSTRSWPGTEIPAAWHGGGATTSTGRSADDGRAVVLPGPAVRLLRLGRDRRRDPARAGRAARSRSATRCPTPTCARSTCCGRSTGWCSSGARCPASSARCSTCSARARWSPAPTTTAAQRRRRPRPTPPTCSTSSARPTTRWGPVRLRAAGRGHARRRRGRCPQVRAWDRDRARPLVRVEPDGAATVVDGSRGRRSPGWRRSARCRAAGGSPTPATSRAGAACAAGGRGRDLRLQPPARARGGADGRRTTAPRWPPTTRSRPTPRCSTCSRRAAPTRRPWPSTTAPATCARRSRPPTRSSPSGGRSRRSTAIPPPTGRPIARSSRGPPLDRGRLRRAARRRRDRAAAVLRPARAGSSRSRSPAGAFPVRPGLEPARLGLRGVRSLRVRIAQRARRPRTSRTAAGGIRELRIPGLRVARGAAPAGARRARAGRPRPRRSTGLTYLFERTTGDDPFRRDPRRGTAGGDARARPARRRARPRARDRPARGARLGGRRLGDGRGAGARLGDRRAGGRPRRRSSPPGASRGGRGSGPRARSTGRRGRGSARGWTAARRGCSGAGRARRRSAGCGWRRRASWCAGPTLVRLVADGAPRRPPVPVTDGQRGDAPSARCTGRTFRLEVLRAAFPAGTPGRRAPAPRGRDRRADRRRRAERAACGATAPCAGRCGDLAGTLGSGAGAACAPTRRVADLDAGRPLRFRPCGAAALPAGRGAALDAAGHVRAVPAAPALAPRPDPVARAAAVPGRVVDSGEPSRDARTGVRLDAARAGLAGARPVLQRRLAGDAATGATSARRGPSTATRWAGACPRAAATPRWRSRPTALVRAGYLVSAPLLALMLIRLIARRPPRVEPPSRRRRSPDEPVAPAPGAARRGDRARRRRRARVRVRRPRRAA